VYVKGEVVKGEVAKGEVIKGEVVKGEVVKGKVVKGEVVEGEVVKGEAVIKTELGERLQTIGSPKLMPKFIVMPDSPRESLWQDSFPPLRETNMTFTTGSMIFRIKSEVFFVKLSVITSP